MSNAFANLHLRARGEEGRRWSGRLPSTTAGRRPFERSRRADARALVKRGEQSSVKVVFRGGSVTAPVRAGQPVGTILVEQNGQTIAKVPAVAGADVEENPWWKKFWPF